MTGEVVAIAVVAIAGLVLGVWLGMPGSERQSAEDIEKAMEAGGGRRRRTKRVFTPMAWMQRKADPKKSSGGAGRRGFKLESPDEDD